MVGKKKSKPRRKAAHRDLRMDNEYMSWIEDVRFAVKQTMLKDRITIAELAQETGRCEATIRRFITDDPDWSKRTMAPRGDTLFALTNALNVPFGVPEGYLQKLRGVDKRRPKGER